MKRKKKIFRLDVSKIETIDDIKVIFSLMTPMITVQSDEQEKAILETDLFFEACAICGNVMLSDTKESPVPLCNNCFEKEKSDAIKRRIIQK